MARRHYTNTAPATSLSATITDTAVGISVASSSGFPAVPFTAAIERGTTNEEILLVTNVSGTNWTVTRGYSTTTNVAHNSGAPIEHVVSATDYDDANVHINDATRDDHTQYNTPARHAAIDHTALVQIPKVVTSTTRPLTPTNGQLIWESDTKRTYSWDGTKWRLMGPLPYYSATPVATWTVSTVYSTIISLTGMLPGKYMLTAFLTYNYFLNTGCVLTGRLINGTTTQNYGDMFVTSNGDYAPLSAGVYEARGTVTPRQVFSVLSTSDVLALNLKFNTAPSAGSSWSAMLFSTWLDDL